MKTIKDITKNCIVTKDSKKITVDIHAFYKPGWKAHHTYYIFYNNRLISPFEQRVRRWGIPINTLFRIVYANKIVNLIPDGVKLFNKVLKEIECE